MKTIQRPPRWLWWLCLMVGVLAWGLTTYNYHFIRRPLGQVVKVKTIARHQVKDQYQNIDTQTDQLVTVRGLNGELQGKTVSARNTYSRSGAVDHQFKVGEQVFLQGIQQHQGKYQVQLGDLKRDRVLVMLLWAVVSLLLLLMQFKGALALLSVSLNAVLLWVALLVNQLTKGELALPIFAGLTIVFTFVSLGIVLGWRAIALVTAFATLIATALAIGIGETVLLLTHEKGVYFEAMEYVTQVPRTVFIAEIMLGSLGAVMDETADIAVTLAELKQLQPQLGRWEIFQAGRRVGKTIMGPLINVLFLIFIMDTFLNAFLLLKNGNNWGYTFSMAMSLGMVQSLISGIGIVLAIPVVSTLVAWWPVKEARS